MNYSTLTSQLEAILDDIDVILHEGDDYISNHNFMAALTTYLRGLHKSTDIVHLWLACNDPQITPDIVLHDKIGFWGLLGRFLIRIGDCYFAIKNTAELAKIAVFEKKILRKFSEHESQLNEEELQVFKDLSELSETHLLCASFQLHNANSKTTNLTKEAGLELEDGIKSIATEIISSIENIWNLIEQPRSFPKNSIHSMEATSELDTWISRQMTGENIGVAVLLTVSFFIGFSTFSSVKLSAQTSRESTQATEIDSPPSPSQTVNSSSQYGWQFPMAACGDGNPVGEQDFYPVYVNRTDESVLNYLRSNYCADAYVRTRLQSGQKSIQVASYRSKEKAEAMAHILLDDSRVKSGEVGPPSKF